MTLFPTCTRSFLSSEDKTNKKKPKHLAECAVETANTTASADGSHVCFSEQEQRGHSKRRVVAPLSTPGTFLQRCGLSLLLQVPSLKLRIPFAPFYNPATLFLGIVHIYVEQTGRARCLSIWSLDHQQARHRHCRRGTGSEGSPPPPSTAPTPGLTQAVGTEPAPGTVC